MKITIELNECADYGLTPYTVYRRLYSEYHASLTKVHKQPGFWYMGHCCDETARRLYAQLKNRPANVKSLILTYQDAEEVFKLFKQFADVWVKNYIETGGGKP